MATQILDQLKPPVEVRNINEQGEEEPNSPHNNEDIGGRLKDLVNITWVNRRIRLLAWSERDGSWYMWQALANPKKQRT
jgi:hypothetical protein